MTEEANRNTTTRTPSIAQDVASDLVKEMAGRASVTDESGDFPEEDFAAIAHGGLFGAMVPARLGGFGCTFSEYVPIALSLGSGNGSRPRWCSTCTLQLPVRYALTPDPLARALGADDDWFTTRDRLLRDAAQGARFGVAMSERRAGSRLSLLERPRSETRSVFRSDAYVTTVGAGRGHRSESPLNLER